MSPSPLPDDGRPPYLQIADALRTAIRAGEFAPGGQIPTINELATRYGVARNTVRSALRELTDEGLVIPRHGTGVFVRTSLPEPASLPEDGSGLMAVVRELGQVRSEIQALQRRVAHLESLSGEQSPSPSLEVNES